RAGSLARLLVPAGIQRRFAFQLVVVHHIVVLVQHRVAAAEPGVLVAVRRAIPGLAVERVVARFFGFIQVHPGAYAVFGHHAQVLVGRFAMATFGRRARAVVGDQRLGGQVVHGGVAIGHLAGGHAGFGHALGREFVEGLLGWHRIADAPLALILASAEIQRFHRAHAIFGIVDLGWCRGPLVSHDNLLLERRVCRL